MTVTPEAHTSYGLLAAIQVTEVLICPHTGVVPGLAAAANPGEGLRPAKSNPALIKQITKKY